MGTYSKLASGADQISFRVNWINTYFEIPLGERDLLVGFLKVIIR